jgi:hypothetical protein
MNRNRVLALVVLMSCVTCVAAADKYAVPPHPKSDAQRMCAVVFDKGYPKTTGDAKAWTVTINGKYNYDDTWQFKSLEVRLVYNNLAKKTMKEGPKYTVTDETTLATPGSYTTVFSSVTPTVDGEVMEAIGRITIKKTGQLDLTNSVTATVIAPPP